MLTSTAGLLCFIGYVSLRLSLLFSMHRGILAQDDDCMQYQLSVCSVVKIKFKSHASNCGNSLISKTCSLDALDLKSYLQGSSAGTDIEKPNRPRLLPPGCGSEASTSGSERCSFDPLESPWRTTRAWIGSPWEQLPDCETVCVERTADLYYSIARSKADPCIRIMDTTDSTSWDILFRHPQEAKSITLAQGGLCLCKVDMVMQRVVQRLPPESDSANSSADTSPCQAPPVYIPYCEPLKTSERIINSFKVLQQQSWYPEPSFTGANPDYVLEDGIWDAVYIGPGFINSIACDAQCADLFADEFFRLNTLPSGLDPSQSSNCTIKYHVGNETHPGNTVLCCKGESMAPIIKRIELLHMSDLRNKRRENVNIKACMSLPLPNDMIDLIAERLASDSQLEWELFRRSFL
ncbi:hypothetical protein BCR37DRAFT_383849 [Protomyces lactucae-debilis]|uniref:Uncharacterized protein n=1 Tax=Protomyces lactucae-debilis TaxID=2754530 RepID=A0A1Y2EW45_PROLT|nr:uncharacterized protein BCR37DRAFT_383849 [Protomyces lactucae-debilis]ORY75770.1 hypothetical protein BCR37DRAFT_383849 [Protomyces lactucae-debilis]